MDKISTSRLISLLDEEQDEDGTGLDIAPERYIALVQGAVPTAEEIGILLASPLARDLYRVAAAMNRDIGMDASIGEAVFMRLRMLAARGTAEPDLPVELELRDDKSKLPWGRLMLRRGIGGDFAYLLTLTLDPSVWPGGKVDGITLTLAEPGAGGIAWVSGTTDEYGRIMGHWGEDRPDPRKRWNDGDAPRPLLFKR